MALNNMGSAFEDLHHPDSALAYYSRALAITREVGDPAGERTILDNIARVRRGGRRNGTF